MPVNTYQQEAIDFLKRNHYEDFCSEFGYETVTENQFGRLTRNPNAYKIWKACCREWEKVKRVFGEDEILEELREIN